MNETIPVRCACGSLTGALNDLTPHTVNRVVCYCDDCQAFARFLGRAGDILDAHGGSEILQTSSARLRIDRGMDQLGCLRLSPRGLARWYARCCNTAIGNTPANAGFPFVGMLHTCLALPEEEPARSRAAGDIHVRVHGRYAVGDTPALAIHPRAPVTYVLRLMRMLAAARLRGEHRRSPFFDPHGAPRAAPTVLEASQRAALKHPPAAD